jgi:hypothetical protein
MLLNKNSLNECVLFLHLNGYCVLFVGCHAQAQSKSLMSIYSRHVVAWRTFQRCLMWSKKASNFEMKAESRGMRSLCFKQCDANKICSDVLTHDHINLETESSLTDLPVHSKLYVVFKQTVHEIKRKRWKKTSRLVLTITFVDMFANMETD